MRTFLLATAIAASPLVAQSQPVTGLYIGGEAGANFMQDETVKSIGGVATPSTKIQTGVGPALLGTAGWGFGNGLRAELEFDWRSNPLSKVTTTGAAASIGGQEQKFGPMANLVYDFNGLTPWFVPYLGAGVGYQWDKLHITSAGTSITSTTKGAFAYQAIVGAAVPIPQMPGLAFTAEYRFMGLAGDRSYSAPGGSVVTNDDFNHAVLVGLRYNFGVAPPAPMAPMPVADMGAKTFLVFFDWNKADLTARSEGIIHDAAAYSTSTKYTRIDVDGNTDTSGTPSYNQGLSERRARVVASELVRDGVPQGAISMHAYGDTHLLVPTGPNVREPQNRRVDIVYH